MPCAPWDQLQRQYLEDGTRGTKYSDEVLERLFPLSCHWIEAESSKIDLHHVL